MIIAVGMTFVITSAGIDLSVGSLLALVTVIGFDLIKEGMHPLLGVLLMFALGAGIGCLTGLLIAVVKIPPLHRDTRHDGEFARLGAAALGRQHALWLADVVDLAWPGRSPRHTGSRDHRVRFCPFRRLAFQPHEVRLACPGDRGEPRGGPGSPAYR